MGARNSLANRIEGMTHGSSIVVCTGYHRARGLRVSTGSAGPGGGSACRGGRSTGSRTGTEGPDRHLRGRHRGHGHQHSAGDDFYGYVNGTWAKNTQIPADKSNYGAFTALQDTSQQRVRDILDAAKSDPNSRIGNAYSSFLDEAAVEAKGLAPIQPWLDQIRSLKTRNGYAALEGQAARNGITGLFGGGVGQDDRHSDIYITGLGQAGLGMPDRDMYLLPDANFVSLRAAYVDHLAKMLTLAGETNAAARAKAIMAFETGIAKVSWSREDVSDASKTYNRMTLAQLKKLAPGFDWATYLTTRGANIDELLVAEPSAFKSIAALASKVPLQVLRDQLIVQSLDAYADVLPKAVTDENFAFYGTKLNGTPELPPRWKRAVDFTTNVLTDDVSKVYVAKWFPPESKAAMQELVGNIITAMGHRIENLTWMAPETKVKAKAKLAAFTPRIGYPDQWHDYTYDVRRRRLVRQCDARQSVGPRLEHRQARQAGDAVGVGARSDDGQRPGELQPRRDYLPGRGASAALLRSECRSGGQLRRHRRGDRPRDEPPFRRPGLEI